MYILEHIRTIPLNLRNYIFYFTKTHKIYCFTQSGYLCVSAAMAFKQTEVA